MNRKLRCELFLILLGLKLLGCKVIETSQTSLKRSEKYPFAYTTIQIKNLLEWKIIFKGDIFWLKHEGVFWSIGYSNSQHSHSILTIINEAYKLTHKNLG